MNLLPILEGPYPKASTNGHHRKPALGSGLAGAVGVTVLNEIAKRVLPAAPRLDLLGRQLATAAFLKAGRKPPRGIVVQAIALVGDLVSNSLFFGLIGLGKPKTAIARGAALGLLMGVGAATLPAPLGLDKDATTRTKKTAAQTILWYMLGGVLAAFWFTRSHRRSS